MTIIVVSNCRRSSNTSHASLSGVVVVERARDGIKRDNIDASPSWMTGELKSDKLALVVRNRLPRWEDIMAQVARGILPNLSRHAVNTSLYA